MTLPLKRKEKEEHARHLFILHETRDKQKSSLH
jgi:hypothetical protein